MQIQNSVPSDVYTSNGNASETKANESFDNGFFLRYRSEANTFDSKQIIFVTKRTHQKEQKLFSKRSEHIRQQDNCFLSESEHVRSKENYMQIEANTLDRKKIIFEAKRTGQIRKKIFSKHSEHIKQKEYYFRSKGNTLASKKINFEAKRTHQIERKLFSKRSEHISQKENYFRSKANTFDNKKIIFEAKRTRSTVNKLFSKRSEAKRLPDSASRGVGEYFVQVVGFYLNLAIFATWKSLQHGLINYIDTKAKFRHLKN